MEESFEANPDYKSKCFSKACLVRLGAELNVDYIISGSFDLLGRKIVITLKLIDVKNNVVAKSAMHEFNYQENELQRMTEIIIREMHGLEVQKELYESLNFKNELITSTNLGKVNNSGPRVGYGIFVRALEEFATRLENHGGMDIFP